MSRSVQPPFPFVARALAEMGENIRLARLRRGFSVTLVAERAGMSRPTLRAVEHGDPSVSMGRRGGWRLAPAYDLNPVSTGGGLTPAFGLAGAV